MYYLYMFFFFKQKTAYEMRISDWSSDVCSSDLIERLPVRIIADIRRRLAGYGMRARPAQRVIAEDVSFHRKADAWRHRINGGDRLQRLGQGLGCRPCREAGLTAAVHADAPGDPRLPGGPSNNPARKNGRAQAQN